MKRYLLLVLIAALLFAGCNDNDEITPTAVPTATDMEATAAPEPTPAYEMPQLPDLDLKACHSLKMDMR